jgi:4-hydroxy-3-methylbut-2-enyl diphosphate reductase
MNQPDPRLDIFLARPRGYCAGVDRAIDIVDLALELYGPPVYVRHEIVHNSHVVGALRERGAVFVEELSGVPEEAVLVLSAHGVAPTVREEAAARRLKVIDATCPLVTKVHLEALRMEKDGYTIVLIGHRGHTEVEGTMGHVPRSIVLVQNAAEVADLVVPDPDRVAYLTQTTLSLDECAETVAALKARFPKLRSPSSDSICYATQNRQNAVKAVVPKIDLLLVVGSRQSSNSNRLREAGEIRGVTSYLIDTAEDIRPEWLAAAKRIGVTAGASTPEYLVEEVLARLRSEGGKVVEFEVIPEAVNFNLPKNLLEDLKGDPRGEMLLLSAGRSLAGRARGPSDKPNG